MTIMIMGEKKSAFRLRRSIAIERGASKAFKTKSYLFARDGGRVYIKHVPVFEALVSFSKNKGKVKVFEGDKVLDMHTSGKATHDVLIALQEGNENFRLVSGERIRGLWTVTQPGGSRQLNLIPCLTEKYESCEPYRARLGDWFLDRYPELRRGGEGLTVEEARALNTYIG